MGSGKIIFALLPTADSSATAAADVSTPIAPSLPRVSSRAQRNEITENLRNENEMNATQNNLSTIN